LLSRLRLLNGKANDRSDEKHEQNARQNPKHRIFDVDVDVKSVHCASLRRPRAAVGGTDIMMMTDRGRAEDG